MNMMESILAAAFCMAMVFVVLACLFILIKLFSFGVKAIDINADKSMKTDPAPETVSINTEKSEFSSGELKLHNVDERTAAMIMAIVSDESGIPLSELCFKSIKALEKTTNR